MNNNNNKRMRETQPTAEDVILIGRDIQNKSGLGNGSARDERTFREFFGTTTVIVLKVWLLLTTHCMCPEAGTIQHLMWALHFMRAYPKEAVVCTVVGGSGGAIDPKTLRKYIWPFIHALAEVSPLVIVFDNRKKSGSRNDCLLSIDGTDCRIPQLEKCALRYELGIDIAEGNLVWVEGPYPAGEYSDITIFRHALIHHLDPFERVVADDGYVGEAPKKVKCPATGLDSPEDCAEQSRVRSRHETLNGRFKCWEILRQTFRHDIMEHSAVFRAIAVVIQCAIDEGE